MLIGQKTDTEPKEVYKYTEPEAPIANKPPRDARPGFKWVRHNDHWDEVPVTPTQGNDSPEVHLDPVNATETKTQTYTGPLTYDEELFKTNPVKSLRLELEARGNWAAEHIPSFPPDDLEAQEIARYEYMITFMNIDDAKELWDLVFNKHQLRIRLDRKYGKFSARSYDLSRLGWGHYNSPYDISADFLDNLPWYPSEYFPTLDPDNDATPITRQKKD